MAKDLIAGDGVRIIERVQLPADIKTNMYFPHYAGLTGVIGKVYPDNTASVTVDIESLPPAIRKRHENSTQSMRQKWLDGLSDEARNRLTAAEKKLTLRYAILVAVDDLSKEARSASIAAPAEKKVEAPVKAVAATVSDAGRKTLEAIEAEEAKHFAEIAVNRNADDPALDF